MAKKERAPTVCPVSGKVIPYDGRGRPPKFHLTVKAAARKKYNASLKAAMVELVADEFESVG